MAQQKQSHRQVVLDTETTGVDVKKGHRVIEIGLVELIDRVATGRTFQTYLNPMGATMDPEAEKVHGLSLAFLADKPQFSQKCAEFCSFIQGAEVLIHNAAFDEGFLNAELARVNKPPIWEIAAKITDTYMMAQSVFPKQANGLDKLCKRLEISNEHRTFHGALLDAELLTEVYLKMTQDQSPYIDDAEIGKLPRPPVAYISDRKPGPALTLSVEDKQAHESYLDELEKANKKPSVWRSGPVSSSKAPSP
jgi:DNA polymerase-3 subunit epsilon